MELILASYSSSEESTSEDETEHHPKKKRPCCNEDAETHPPADAKSRVSREKVEPNGSICSPTESMDSPTLYPSTLDSGVVLNTDTVAGAYVSKRRARKTTVESTHEATRSTPNFKDPKLDSYLKFGSETIANSKNKLCVRLSQKWQGHSKPAVCLDWHPSNPRLLLSSGFDGFVKMWDVSTTNNTCACVLRNTAHNTQAVSVARWISSSNALSGGYDCRAANVDYMAMKCTSNFYHEGHVTALKPHPSNINLFVTGDASKSVQLWDMRMAKPISRYLGAGGQILDVEFINGGTELVASCDIVRKNAGSKMLLVWETSSAVVRSHQIYDEPYTCPCLKASPTGNCFLAQSNADYIVLFNSQKPFKINKYKRFEGHSVSGYNAQFDISPDGTLLSTASVDGKVYQFHYSSTKLLNTIAIGSTPIIAVQWHPSLSSKLACTTWNGSIAVCE